MASPAGKGISRLESTGFGRFWLWLGPGHTLALAAARIDCFGPKSCPSLRHSLARLLVLLLPRQALHLLCRFHWRRRKLPTATRSPRLVPPLCRLVLAKGLIAARHHITHHITHHLPPGPCAPQPAPRTARIRICTKTPPATHHTKARTPPAAARPDSTRKDSTLP